LYLGMEGHGGSGGSRVVVVLELVRLGVDAPDEEEAGDGGGEEDEDDPQRAHLKLQTPEGTNQSNQNERRGRGKSKAIEHRSPFSSPTNPGYLTRSQHFFFISRPVASGGERSLRSIVWCSDQDQISSNTLCF
jgi:hypothetical protein